MKYTIELIKVFDEELLEGPVFDEINDILYFVSILDFRVYKYTPVKSTFEFIQLNSPTSCVFLSPVYGVVVATTESFYKVDFDSKTAEKIFEVPISSGLRFNDGTIDPRGRFLIGTMGYPKVVENAGSLLSFDKGVVKTLVSGTTISNGIAFSKDASFMYYIDTPTRVVKVYEYDIETGMCKYLRDLIHFTEAGEPDGMDIDENGHLWIAEWGGYGVSVWNPETGSSIGRVEIPVENVTSVCFDTTNNLYVTTARSHKDGISYGGSLFYVKVSQP